MHRHLMTLVTTGQPRSLRLEPPAQITAEVYVDERGRTREICHLAKLDSLSSPIGLGARMSALVRVSKVSARSDPEVSAPTGVCPACCNDFDFLPLLFMRV